MSSFGQSSGASKKAGRYLFQIECRWQPYGQLCAQEAIEAGVENFDFSDTGNFDIEYGIEYDGKVHCESHDFNSTYELTEMIVKKVHALFVEAECPEDELDTTEDDNHPVEKLQN